MSDKDLAAAIVSAGYRLEAEYTVSVCSFPDPRRPVDPERYSAGISAEKIEPSRKNTGQKDTAPYACRGGREPHII